MSLVILNIKPGNLKVLYNFLFSYFHFLNLRSTTWETLLLILVTLFVIFVLNYFNTGIVYSLQL